MSYSKNNARLTSVISIAIGLFFGSSCFAIPTFIGVTSGVQRQSGGNPGTFVVMMNQNYSTLHASVLISINGANFKEYTMIFDGSVSKNFKWSYIPAAVYPANATIKYYFRGWDDAGGNIFDGSSATSYSFVAAAPAVVSVPGDVDLYGSNFTVGSLLDDLNRAVFYLSASDGGVTSLVRLGATRPANEWVWERGSAIAGGGPVPMMKLDASNRLTLFDPAALSTGTIVLDPTNPPGIFINGQRVLTSTTAATTYLPLNPVQLSVGVNNVVGSDAFAAGSSIQATGRNATAFGSNAIASGDNSVAVGDHTSAQGLGQFIAGAYNLPQGSGTSSNLADQLFVIANGTDDSHRANALTVLRNGNVGVGTTTPAAKLEVNGGAAVNGDLEVTGTIHIAPQGDLSMGEFTHGQAP